jgi:hypothetical protein
MGSIVILAVEGCEGRLSYTQNNISARRAILSVLASILEWIIRLPIGHSHTNRL